MKRICQAISQLVKMRDDIVVALPVHLNPNVRDVVLPMLQQLDRVILLDPQGYQTLVHLMMNAEIVLTDSGGIQEEAASLSKPVLVLRSDTERPEGVKAGVAELVGTDVDKIVSRANTLLDDPAEYRRVSNLGGKLYGDGTAGSKIGAVIRGYFAKN